MDQLFESTISSRSEVQRSLSKLRLYFRGVHGEEFTIQNAVLLIFAFAILYCFLRIIKNSSARQRKHRKVKLGQRPVHMITDPEQALQEIHFASCYCGKNALFIDRCMALLEKFPAACNIPIHSENYTPFLRACFNGCPELMSYMLQNGADMSITTSLGDNAMYLATYSIISGKCDTFTPLKLLIAAGMDINAPRKHGYTALHLAAYKGDSKVVRWLLAHGADPTPPCRVTPRELALQNGHYSIATLLRVDTGEETQHTCMKTVDFD